MIAKKLNAKNDIFKNKLYLPELRVLDRLGEGKKTSKNCFWEIKWAIWKWMEYWDCKINWMLENAILFLQQQNNQMKYQIKKEKKQIIEVLMSKLNNKWCK